MGSRPTLSLLALAACAALAACSRDSGAAAPTFEGPRAHARSSDPRAAEARAALEAGRPAAARALVEGLGPALGAEAGCLEARTALAEGEPVAALAALEAARTEYPGDPRPYATAAEVYTALGRLSAAQEEIDRGIELFGRGPELVRALGVLALASPGQAKLGLALIEEARRGDPELPFCNLPLVRGNALMARSALGANAVAEAERYASAALEIDPNDADAREALAEVRLAQRRFGEARALYEELFAEGLPVREALVQATRSTATQAMVDKDRALQVECLLRLRALGLSMDELGFGASILRQEADTLIERAVQAYDRADRLQAVPDLPPAALDELVAARVREWETSEALLRRALDYDPLSVEARHRLGETLFRLASYEQAAREWEAVLNLCEDPEQLGSAVHLNLARAYKLAGDGTRAREVCEVYLAERPGGRWVDETSEMLTRL